MADVIERDGLKWAMRRDVSDEHLGPAGHEEEFTELLTGLLVPDGLFLDIGAHVGHWSLRLAHKASQVVAIEANPDTAERLRENITLNDLFAKVQVRELAAWDSHGTVALTDPNGHAAGGSTYVIEGDTVTAAPLDDVLILPRLDLVKIDVEGAEAHVLRGMKRLLTEHNPVLFVEMHHLLHGLHIWDDTMSVLDELGYTQRSTHGSQQIHLVCRKV